MRGIVGCLWLLSACASYSIEANGEGDGYDVYRPEPYILVVQGGTDDEAQVVASVVWLPDYGARYRIDTWNVFGKADFSFAIENGWKLTNIADRSDNAAAFSRIVEFATDLATARIAPLADSRVQLLKIIYNEEGRVTGLARVDEATLEDHHPPPVR